MSTPDDLAAYLKTQHADIFITDCHERAVEMVEHLKRESLTEIPDEIVDLAVMEVGVKLYAFRDAPQGVSNYGDMDFTPIRVSSDAMITARKILAPYMKVGFA